MPHKMNKMPQLSKFGKFCWECGQQATVVLLVLGITSSWIWIPVVYGTVMSVGENTKAIAELVEIVGGMGQLFGNAEILGGGERMTASINVHSDAGRWSKSGRRLTVTNTGDRREMSVNVTVEGKFEGEPHLFLNLSRAAGEAIGAKPGDEIQVAIELFEENPADD